MGQFKPMVKMMTTEPTVELKLKKGGSVKKADGGMMGAAPMPTSMPSSMPPAMPARGGSMGATAPLAPSLAARRRAMRMMGSGPAAPIGVAASRMKEGGESKAESAKEMKQDTAQDKAMIKKAFKQHDMQEHKGGKGTDLKLKKGGMKKYATGGAIPSEESSGSYDTTKVYQAKADNSSASTGGVKNGNGGGFKRGGKIKKMATGGVVKGQAGYATGGVIPSQSSSGVYTESRVDTSRPDNSPAKTGGVNLGNAGGFKRGGSAKKHFATGGSVNSAGSAVAMPQGRKPIPSPVMVTQLAGTYKRGGSVAPGNRQLQSVSKAENTPAMRAAKADSNLKYGPANKMKLKEGGDVDLSKGAYDATLNEPPMGMGFAKKAQGFINSLFEGKKDAGAGRGFVNPKSVTKSKESVTITPMKKGGSAKC